MSPFTKVKMSYVKGTESGQTTNDERKRIEQIGSDAAAGREAAGAKRSSRDAGGERTASQTAAEQVSWGRSKWAGEPTAWKAEPQPVKWGGEAKRVGFAERKILRLWADVGVRETGGGGKTKDIG